MKRSILTLIIAVTSLTVAAQPDGHDRYGVTTHVYEFLPETDTPAPAGYVPIYIGHYGRHGSRTEGAIGDVYRYLLDIFATASGQHLLTAQGDSIYAEVRRVDDAHRGMDGSLTQRGVAEHKELAQRIYNRYPTVFRNGSKFVRVETSTSPRCIVSMASFVSSLTAIQNDLQFSMETGEKTVEYIGRGDQKDLREKVSARCEEINDATIVDTMSILRTLFKDEKAARKVVGSVNEFQRQLFMCAREGLACGVEEDMFRYIPEDVCRKWWSHLIRTVYMRNCNSVEYGDYRMENARQLVSVMLSHACQALESGEVAADLIFGHDFPLLGLANWFGLSGVGDRLSWNDRPRNGPTR